MDFRLKVDEATGKVPYLYRNDAKHPVTGMTTYEAAMWQMQRGEAHVSGEYEGYPLTSDDVYFFAGEENVAGQGDGSSVPEGCVNAERVVSVLGQQEPSPLSLRHVAVVCESRTEGSSACPDGVELGADGLPLPAGDGKKKGRKKRNEG